MSSLVDKYVSQLADKLIKKGKDLVEEALRTKTYEHDTYNLHDSYGAGVYYKGRLIREYYNTPSKAKKPKKNLGELEYGKDNIRDYLHSEYKPTTNGIVLVVIATMFYGEILESGGGKLKQKYKVISQISSSAELVANEFKGKVNKIGL
jgi:hypothetical protein